jgi:hypothetical protein
MRTEIKFAKGFMLLRRRDRRGNIVGEREYLDRRCGVAWPTVHSPGYACIMGLYNEAKPRRVRLLWEFRSDQRSKLIDKTVVGCRRYGCKWAFADLQGEYEPHLYAWWRHCKNLKIDDLQINDVHDIGGIVNARADIDDMTHQGLLRIPRKTILYGEGMRLTPDLVRAVEHVPVEAQFPAMTALAHVVVSYSWYPYKKDKKTVGGGEMVGSRAGYG